MSSSSSPPPSVFRVGGPRSFVSSSTVSSLISPLLVPGVRFREVSLSGHSYDLGAANVIASALKSLPSDDLVSVDFSDCISGRPLSEAPQILRTLCDSVIGHSNIESVSLSDNAIGVSGTPSILPLLSALPNLQRLYLNNNGMSADPLSSIVSAVKSRQLTHFEVSDNMMDSEGAESLVPLVESSKTLEHFRMAKTRVKPKGGKAIVSAIVKSKGTLQYLNLLDNSLGEHSGYLLGQWLESGGGSSLRTLIIGDVGFDRKGLKRILSALSNSPHRPRLIHLDLQCSDITPKMASLVRNVVRSNAETLKTLNLEGNKLHSVGCAAIVDEIASCHQLDSVNLVDNGINRSGKRVLSQQIKGRINRDIRVKLREDDEESDDDDDEPEDKEEEDEEEEEEEEEKDVQEITDAVERTKM